MDVLVTGRHCQISDSFRDHVRERITRIERLRDRVIRVEVQVSTNKRQPDQAARVEITLFSKGPVVRSEGVAEEKMAAFEQALERMRSQLRKAADRRKHHRGHKGQESVRHAQPLPDLPVTPADDADNDTQNIAGIEVMGDGPLVVREKSHPSEPMTLAEALDRMELVGHDFFLYNDADHGCPSVVYRRRAYDYGVIRLDDAASDQQAATGRAGECRSEGDLAGSGPADRPRRAGLRTAAPGPTRDHA